MTTLLDEIKTLIAQRGPVTVEQYMQMALSHPDYGYYMSRDPFGATGDFTTSPEISQMFGELVGLWAGEVWSSMGSPGHIRLVELGPGRGTLMSDALRALRVVPAFREAADVWLVETSPTLAMMQHELLLDCGVGVSWAQSLRDVPDGPAIVIGNEFLDALPVRQFVRVAGQWRERVVRLDEGGNLAFDVARNPERLIDAKANDGEMLEVNPAGHRFMFELGARLVKQNGAALLIDYGHSATGVRRHFAGAARSSLCRSARSSGRVRSHRPCRFRRHGEKRQRDRRRGLRAGRSGRLPAGHRHRPANEGARRARRRRSRAGPRSTRDRGSWARRRAKWAALFKALGIANRRVPALPGFQPLTGGR